MNEIDNNSNTHCCPGYNDKVDFKPWKLPLKTENNSFMTALHHKVLKNFKKSFEDAKYFELRLLTIKIPQLSLPLAGLANWIDLPFQW